jgi:glycosyltransferase involved in cell wall biosynthesis
MKRPLKIAFITEMYSEKMGYSENFLPKAVARLGHEVHVIASTAQVYFNSPSYKKTYEPFLGPNIVAPGTKEIDGYTLHRLPLKPAIRKNVIRLEGLKPLLEQLAPDIIQAFNIYSVTCYEAALIAQETGARFFTESHVHASVFDMRDPKTRLRHLLLGFPRKLKVINRITEKHYPIAKDVAKISLECFGVPPEKTDLQSLGVDTGLFTPVVTPEDELQRARKREELGFTAQDIVCIYTGRLTADKNPQCLARAVRYLRKEGHARFKALFVGSGTPEDMTALRSVDGCVVHPFVKVNELPFFYRAADIGVWPRQESMSQLDATACGLPIIVSDHVEVTERIEGNGLLYKEDDEQDLAEKILNLENAALRRDMALRGRKKVEDQFSWDALAKRRINDFEQSLDKKDPKA